MTRRLSLLLMAVLFVGFQMMPGRASSHREAPLMSLDPSVDNTDTYAFVSPADPTKVVLVASWIPFENPAGGPNFYAFDPSARYNIYIDNNGDGVADISYWWNFSNQVLNGDTFLHNTGPVRALDDPNLNIRQSYFLSRAEGTPETGRLSLRAGPSLTLYNNVGNASTPNYGGNGSGVYVFNTPQGVGRVFAGQSDDPFFLDLRVFNLLYGADFSEAGVDTLAGFNVHTTAIEVPIASVTRNGAMPSGPSDPNGIIGVWSTADRRTTRVLNTDGSQSTTGAFVQVSRLGMPLVNEVVIPLKDKDKFNASKPENDAQFLSYVTDPGLPRVINAVYGLPIPATPRNDLVQVFLTGVPGLNQPAGVKASEQIRLNLGIPPSAQPNRLGVIGGDLAGYPNGRRLADDIVDISLRVVEGALTGSTNQLSDGVDRNDRDFQPVFPYVGLSHSGSNRNHLSK